eukprot:1632380-Pleurochrysis_carterae.AAC.4
MDTQRMVVKLGLQREALADPTQILQRLMVALFFNTPQPTVEDTLRWLSPEGTGNDSLVFQRMISQQLMVHMSVALGCLLSTPGRLKPPCDFDVVLIPLIKHL